MSSAGEEWVVLVVRITVLYEAGTVLSGITDYFPFPFHSSCLAVFGLRRAVEY